jgi:hypothetical protein
MEIAWKIKGKESGTTVKMRGNRLENQGNAIGHYSFASLPKENPKPERLGEGEVFSVKK